MMDFLELVKARCSVREYLPQAVEKEKIDYILECARLAPSATNKQPWHFFVIQNKAIQSELHKCYAGKWFAQAPLYIVVCVDASDAWVRKYDNKNHADIDGAIATEHICLAAAEQGLGSCWVCHFDTQLCAKILQLPSQLFPLAIIPIGYPGGEVASAKKRKSIETVASFL